MSKEYIDKEAVLALKQDIGAYGMDISSKDVERIPAADVVPVVWCKDCRWYVDDNNNGFCDRDGYSHNGRWYCADGERRE